MHNKVVYQVAKSLDGLGLPVLRFNFRGAGLSEGKHDRGQGEQGDVRAAVDFLAGEFPGVPVLLAGLSFGCWVGLRVGCADRRVAEQPRKDRPAPATVRCPEAAVPGLGRRSRALARAALRPRPEP